jgi:kinesin family protein 15
MMTVRSKAISGNGVSKVCHSKFTLVDLAGSEWQKTTAADGDQLKEASMINSLLLVIGKVINLLINQERGKPKHVQLRDSKLTFLLRDLFGGNSKTCLVAPVSPSVTSLSETISTLTFAQRVKLITNTAVLNKNTRGSVVALQAEIARLKVELEIANNGPAQLVANGGDWPLIDQGLSLLESVEEKKPASDVTVNALRSQNSKLSKKVKVLGEVSDHRLLQVNLLKRKLQQETLIRKCKERRITYLSSKGKTSGMEGGEEIAVLGEEVAALREQLKATPSESVKWMLKGQGGQVGGKYHRHVRI